MKHLPIILPAALCAALAILTSSGLRAAGFEAPPPAVRYEATSEVPVPETAPAFSALAGRVTTEVPLAPASGSVPLLTEYAENTTNVSVSPASPGYTVVQSNLVAQGSSAFWLVNASFQNVYLTLNSAVVPTSTTKLFFVSWFGYATTQQWARVEVSTNNGSSWTVLWSLQGANGPTQTGFHLESVSLAAYAGQSLRIRFGAWLDKSGAWSAYTDTSSPYVGWTVDDIQIGSEFDPLLYTGFGNPAPEEVLFVEFINRARADAVAEASRLRNTSDSNVQNACSAFGVNFDLMATQFAALTKTLPPLAINAKLMAAARLHSQDMFNNAFQDHTSSSNPPLPDQAGDSSAARITRQEYVYQTCGENIFAYAYSPWYCHAGFEIDWGYGTGGMQNPAGHRMNIHSADFAEVGVGVVMGTNTKNGTTVGPYVVTEDFGVSYTNPGPFLVGVTYRDANADGFYSLGEGLGGVQVSVDGVAFGAVSSSSGAYAVPLPGDGTYSVNFSCSGYRSVTKTVTVSGGGNVKADYPAVVETPVKVLSTLCESGVMHITVSTTLSSSSIEVVTSTDLKNWTTASFTITSLGGNQYRIDLASGAASGFFLVRQK